MSQIRGSFGVTVQFNDSTVVGGAKSLKSIALQHATEYDFGKIAIVSGTCGTGTAAANVAVNPTTYRNSAGNIVAFTNTVSRVAFSASAAGQVRLAGTGNFNIFSRANQIAISETTEPSTFSVSTTAGTSQFTLVLYGT
jgi:hypothetical protein